MCVLAVHAQLHFKISSRPVAVGWSRPPTDTFMAEIHAIPSKMCSTSLGVVQSGKRCNNEICSVRTMLLEQWCGLNHPVAVVAALVVTDGYLMGI